MSPLLLWQHSRQVNSMLLTAVASTIMAIEFLTPMPVHTNISKAENLALQNFRKDQDYIIVTADKGVALVVKDKNKIYHKIWSPPTRQLQVYQCLSKTDPQLSTTNSLKFCKTTGIKISSLKLNTPFKDLMVPTPQQQDFIVFLKSTKTTCLCTPWFQPLAQQLTTLPNSPIKFSKLLWQDFIIC